MQLNFLTILQFYNLCYHAVTPASDMRDAAAAAVVGITPVEEAGFDKCRSLKINIKTPVNINNKKEPGLFMISLHACPTLILVQHFNSPDLLAEISIHE